MKRVSSFSFLFCLFVLGACATNANHPADDNANHSVDDAVHSIVWKGEVNSDGTPSKVIKLELGKHYQIEVSKVVNLGKWWQQGEPFAEDACYEFNPKIPPKKLNTLRNSMNITIGDGQYHPDHVYTSPVFTASQTGIHFWVYDSDYNDNSGSFQVKVFKINVDPSNGTLKE
ncbi:hypothetical protein [Candidatus Protochlamydia phocaeensis]|uniref:hypothetical protein n=1 Tax=Candidatus Protochlamydia phocaeensis TaxID=1414722 RepID=UPI0008383312|nr:hypothetical protein [Candidatus Protochlamydia phocaeensis]